MTHYFWSPTITPTLDDSLLLGMEYRAVFTKIAYTATYKTNLGYVGGLLQYDFSENSGDKNPNDYKPEGKHFFEFAITIDNNYSAPIITAKANNGYRFVQWSDGSTDPQRHAVPDEGYRFERWEYVVYDMTHYFWSPTITPTLDDSLLLGMEYRAVFTKIV